MFIAHSQRSFIAVSALLFAASVALTLAWCGSMSAMREMPMPGGWHLSMMWMRMPGQSLPGAAAGFLGMWLVMMVAMMLPSLMPMLWRYRCRIGAVTGLRVALLTSVVGGGYFAIWMLCGALAFAVGTALAELAMRVPALARAAPPAAGAIVLIAGALQFSAWKAQCLACCRGANDCCDALRADLHTAWRHGLRLGVQCVQCCLGLTIALLAVGMMDLRAMALVTAAISAERLSAAGERLARAVGVLVVAVGVMLLAHAALPP